MTLDQIIESGYKSFMRKMAMPQYAEYRKDDKLAQVLLDDCIHEAFSIIKINSKTKEILKNRSENEQENRNVFIER